MRDPLHFVIFSVIFGCASLPPLTAQPTDRLGDYAPFFRQQSQTYQKWLDQSGLGAVLRVQDTEVRHDSLVLLYLGFYTEDVDTIWAQWQQLKTGYRSLDNGSRLERELLEKMAYYLEIRPEQGQVRLFDTYDLDKTPCFKTKIHFLRDTVRLEESRCKNELRTVSVKASDLSASKKKLSSATFKKQYGQQAVFDKLIPYFRNRYTRQQCDNRYPTFNLFSGGEDLHFTVNDLCKEVLIDETNPWWCKALYGAGCGSCKNCIKRERLDIRIRYEATADGFRLITDINAAYGSGWYDRPRDNGYHDLQLDYPQALKTYADQLNEAIYQRLLRP